MIFTCDAIIPVDNKVLLIKRNTEPFKGKYALPGGKVEDKELIKDALIREVKEELGIDVVPFAMLGVYDVPDRDPRGRYVSIAYLCKPEGELTKENIKASKREVESVELIPLIDIVEGKIEMAFDHIKMIKSYYAISRMGKRV